MIKKGVVYCVTGSNAYLASALISAIVLRSFEPILPITIVSNLPVLKTISLNAYLIDTQLLTIQGLEDNHPFVSRYAKTRLIQFSPYHETLFLDADILPCQSISQLWTYLNQASLAMAFDRLPQVEMCDHISEDEKLYTLAQIPPFSTQFNSGVMLWKNNTETQELFHQWQREWDIFQKQDQLALVRALHRTQMPVAQIPQTYNVSPKDSLNLIQEGYPIYLLHCWGGMVASGEFRRIAQSRYPEIVKQVDDLISSL